MVSKPVHASGFLPFSILVVAAGGVGVDLVVDLVVVDERELVDADEKVLMEEEEEEEDGWDGRGVVEREMGVGEESIGMIDLVLVDLE